MNLLAIIPWWGRALLLLTLSTVLTGYGWVKGAHHVRGEWDTANLAVERAHSKAITDRIASNATQASKQAAINADITKGKDHEIATLTARVNATPRMQRPNGICGGLAAPTQVTSTGSSNSTDSSGGVGQSNAGRDIQPTLVREDIDRDIKAYKIAVETDLATGRTCQAWLNKNGFSP